MLDVYALGDRIRQLRVQKGLTQSAFAEALHVSFQAVSNWERGISPPDLENLMGIAACFGVLVDELLSSQKVPLALGIDGGGTKTEFAVVTSEGKVLGRTLKEGSNPNDVGIERAAEILCAGIGEALQKHPSVTAVFGGVAGAGTGENASRLTRIIKTRYPRLTVKIQTDSANLFALDDDAGMALISGTGSVVFVKQGEEFLRLGGWGYLLDSAGSAYDIGRDAVTQALAEEDGKLPPCTTSRLLRERLGVTRVWDAVSRLYTEGRPLIASLTGAVFEAYDLGDPHAVAIVDRNAARLGKLLNLGMQAYGAAPKTVVSGGIAEHHGDILLPHVQKHTNARLCLGSYPPIAGACRRASQLLEQQATAEEFFQRFEETYGGK